ncbi:MAG: PAS domain-containing sensor histidine kinase, partial [Actinomycetota bacterium]|nr:PAS domain-containing sensor histidine kinase [Actinomycetota bacterium]
AEEELREAEEKYRSIFENAVEGIYQATVEGRLLTANPAMARILGYESPEELMESVTDIAEQLYVDPADREEFKRHMRSRGSISGFETEMYRKDGRVVSVSFAARTLRDPSTGEPIGYEGTMEDISERRRNEEALREMREAERRRLARDLHDVVLQDLTYSLQSMQVSRHMARKDGGDDDLDQQIEALRRAVGGLRDAIYDLRLESFQEQSLLRSVESLVELNRRMSTGWEVDLITDGELPDLPGVAKVEIIRVIQEALANARRHSAARHVEVVMGADRKAVWAEVRDDGRGFDVGETRGMGITGMRERAAALGGELEVRSEPGSGTEVRLRVPLSSLNREDLELSGP